MLKLLRDIMRWSSSVKMSVKYQNHRTMIKTDPWCGGSSFVIVFLLLPGVVVGDAVALLEHLALHGLDGLDPLRPMKVIQSESKILRLTSHLFIF